MSETQPDQTIERPAAPDPSDPQNAVARIAAEREALERSYRERLTQQQARTATLETRNAALEQERGSLEFSTVSNALEAAERERDLIKGQIKAAMEAANSDLVADLTMRAGEVGAEIAQLRAGKQQMEAQRSQRLAPPQPKTTTPEASPQEQSEAWLAQQHAGDAAWIRAQRDAQGGMRYFTDAGFRAEVAGAHNAALREGLSQHTPQYYEFIERRTGVKNDTQQRQAAPEPAREPEGMRAPPSAPSRPAASYTDDQRRGNTDTQIPLGVVRFCVGTMGFVDKANKPDMARIADYWRESRRMARGREYKVADPWAGAR